jgi:hypothetical protein
VSAAPHRVRLAPRGTLASRTCLLLLALLVGVAHADLRVQVDRTRVEEGETLLLLVRVDARAEGPDLAALGRDFEVLGNQKSSQFRAVAGRSSVTTEWRLTLLPRRTGTLEIPALTVAGETSTPIPVEVRPVSGRTRRLIDSTVFFDNELDRDRVHVQEQLVYTVRLFYAEGVQLYMDLPATPELPDAIVQPLGDVRAYKKRIDDRTYDVIEQRYAVFPQRSGTLRLPEVSVTGGVRLPRGTAATRQRTITISSEPLDVVVDPRPDTWPEDADWLPASRVALIDRVPDGPARAGEPLERTLLLVVDGQPANLLPAVEAPVTDRAPPDADGVRVYPERPITADDFIASGIRGSRAETATLIPGAVSDLLVLPEVRLPWWNTDEDRLEVAVLPERRIPVRGGGAMAVAPPLQAGGEDAAEDPGTRADAATDPARGGRDAPGRRLPPLPWIAALALIALGTFALLSHRAGRPAAPVAGSAPDPAGALRAACRGGDPGAIEAALGPWLDARGLPRADSALATACARLGAPAPDAVRALRALRYGPDAAGGSTRPPDGPPWSPEALLAWANAVDRARRDRAREQRRLRGTLPPLYGSGSA